MAFVRNISNGPRGAYKGATLVMAEPGEVIEADDFAEEWFGPADPLDHDGDGKKGGSKPRKSKAKVEPEGEANAEGEPEIE